MYPHEGSGEPAQPTNWLEPLPPAIPPMGQASGHAVPAEDQYRPRSEARPRESGVLGKLGFGRGGSDQADQSATPPHSRRPKVNLPNRPLLLGDLLAGVAAIVLFLASFTPFVSYDSAKLTDDLKKNDLSTWFTAWSTQTFMAPLTWFVVLAALMVLAITAHKYFRGNEARFLTFTLPQLQLVFALFSAVTLIGYAVSRKSVIFGADYSAAVGKVPATTAFDTRLSFSFGGYLMLLMALLAVAGAVLNVLGIERVVLPRPAKPETPPRGAPRTDSPFYGAAVPTSGPGAHANHFDAPVSAQPRSTYDAPVSGQPRAAYDSPVSGQPLPDRPVAGDRPSSGVPSQYGAADGATSLYGSVDGATSLYGGANPGSGAGTGAGQYGAADSAPAQYGSQYGAADNSPAQHGSQYGAADSAPAQQGGQYGEPQWDATRQQGADSSWPAPQVQPTQLYGQLPQEPQRYEPTPGAREPGPYEQTQYDPSQYDAEPQPEDQGYGQHSRRQNPPGTVYGRPPS